MKRASVLYAAWAIVGTSVLVFGCSSSNPVLPPGPGPSDAGMGERGIIVPVDLGASEAAPADLGGRIADAKDALSAPDAAFVLPDGALPAKVFATILDPASDVGVDGGDGDTPVIKNSSRFAPMVRVEVQSQGADPTGDALVSVKATLANAQTGATAAAVSLNQTQATSVPESSSRVYIYSDTPMDLAKLPGGYYDLNVVAVTVGGSSGTASVRIYVDAGPTITFLQPAEGAYLKGSTTVTAIVTDTSSGVDLVEISIGQTKIDPANVASNGMQHSTTVDFGSFNPPLEGAQVVTVLARNLNGNTSLASRKFTVDNSGPTIASTKPATGSMMGKLITIEANVTDPAGVMDSSVIAVVANGDVHFEISLAKGSDGIYRNLFDTTKLPVHAIFPSLSFRAQDVLGNESSVGYLVSLDNTPPMLDLDPPHQVRLYRSDGTCSWPFDPVGPDAIDDGSVVNQLFDIRARIEDRGNTPLTGTADFIPIAAVDPATVKVLILDDTSLPLVVDTSNPPDGICDDINPELVPSVSPQSSKEAQLIDMVSMPANAGSGDFSYQPGVACSGSQPPPKAYCDTTYSPLKGEVMTYVLGYTKSLPSIWTIAPIVSDGLQCAGRQFDASNNLHDGWACIAVQASDKLGNMQVSRPIRACIVGQPGSTACNAAATGGADIKSIAFPAPGTGDVTVTTESAILGKGGVAVATGDTLIFSGVTAESSAQVYALASSTNGELIVSPQGTTMQEFALPDAATVAAVLWEECTSDTKGAYKVGDSYYLKKGMVGLLLENGQDIQVTGATTQAGHIMLLSHAANPTGTEAVWAVGAVQGDRFSLAGTKVTLSGFATAASNLPNCTGTVVPQPAGQPEKVDATKPCKPWASYLKTEAILLD